MILQFTILLASLIVQVSAKAYPTPTPTIPPPRFVEQDATVITYFEKATSTHYNGIDTTSNKSISPSMVDKMVENLEKRQLYSTTTTPLGCAPTNLYAKGFNIMMYSYPYSTGILNDTGFDMTWFANGGYKELGNIEAAVYGVTDINFEFTNATQRPYGFANSTVDSFSLEFEGFFFTTQSGYYTFNVQAYDGVSFQLGSQVQDACCGTDFGDNVITADIFSATT